MITYTLSGIGAVVLIAGVWLVGAIAILIASEAHVRRLEE